jgi:cytidylate kinase
MRKLVIAIDGFSSTGKSSISKVLAEKLGLIHVDTGALYRAVTLFALQNHLLSNIELDLLALENNLNKIHLQFRNENNILVLYLNDINISEEIRSTEVSNYVSIIAKQKFVRDFLLEMQKSWGKEGGIIMDGRDIGTVVFPNADFKFFLTASIEERSKRRFLELKNSQINADLNEVKQNLINRDKIDSERSIAPLAKAEDAILIDNSELTKEETINKIYNIIQNKK